jgi:exonuclease VII small subunit
MERRLASEGIEPGARKEIIKYQKELESLRKVVSGLESEMIQYEEAQTYFKPTNKGNKLRDELQTKIDKAVESIAVNKRKISDLVQKINDLKSATEE